jgi:hypothetical protein
MTTTRAPLLDVYDHSSPASTAFATPGLRTTVFITASIKRFYDSLFLMGSDGDDGWTWSGDYRSTVTKGGMTLYQSGFVRISTATPPTTIATKRSPERAGIAKHRLDLARRNVRVRRRHEGPYGLMPY